MQYELFGQHKVELTSEPTTIKVNVDRWDHPLGASERASRLGSFLDSGTYMDEIQRDNLHRASAAPGEERQGLTGRCIQVLAVQCLVSFSLYGL